MPTLRAAPNSNGQKKYPTDACISCYKNPGEAHYAGSLVWHVPSSNFAQNYVAYTVKLGGPLASCDCTHGEFASGRKEAATCSHVEYARFKEAQRTQPQSGELFEGEEIVAPVVMALDVPDDPDWTSLVDCFDKS